MSDSEASSAKAAPISVLFRVLVSVLVNVLVNVRPLEIMVSVVRPLQNETVWNG